jgi:hypothetical protein
MRMMQLFALAAMLGVVQIRSYDLSPVTANATQAQGGARILYGYQVMFRFTQNRIQMAPETNDQLTVIFSSRSAEAPRPPQPFFGQDILQEFSFSGQNFVKDQLQFTRRVMDKSFVDAAYIRVINHGSGGWGGDKIWLTVDGEEVLNGVSMSPRVGPGRAKGFQLFNPGKWPERSYWEAQLQPFRKGGKRQ